MYTGGYELSTILSPITTVFTAIFNVIHNCVVSTGLFSVGAGYVMAVLILTILVRLLILPLNIKQMKSQQAMAEIQPEIAKLQKKYKGNPEKANQEIRKINSEIDEEIKGQFSKAITQSIEHENEKWLRL